MKQREGNVVKLRTDCKLCGAPTPVHKLIQKVCPACRTELYELETSQDVLNERKMDIKAAKGWAILIGLSFLGWLVYSLLTGSVKL